MLDAATLIQVPPFADVRLELGRRLNLLTGDNSAGKTFFLDLAWSSLTQGWSRLESWFDPEADHQPRLVVEGHRAEASNRYRQEVNYSFPQQRWVPGDSTASEERGDSLWSGPVLYLQASGGARLWDPSRDPRRSRPARPDDLLTFDFTAESILHGLFHQDKVVCEGLVRDWVNWQRSDSPIYHQLTEVMATLSEEAEPLRPGEPTRVSTDDVRNFPTLSLSYGIVPFTKASAGVRRILSLAYLLVWMWQEHLQACKQRKQEPTRRLVVLVDELECHLHPRWQRRILPALLKAIEQLTEERVEVQMLVTTHAPLILSSLENHFDPDLDRLFHFEMGGAEVQVEQMAWAKFGDASGWLTSPAFDVESGGYSLEAERAMKAADDLMAGLNDQLPPELQTADLIQSELARSLDALDPYWTFWQNFYRKAKEPQ